MHGTMCLPIEDTFDSTDTKETSGANSLATCVIFSYNDEHPFRLPEEEGWGV